MKKKVFSLILVLVLLEIVFPAAASKASAMGEELYRCMTVTPSNQIYGIRVYNNLEQKNGGFVLWEQKTYTMENGKQVDFPKSLLAEAHLSKNTDSNPKAFPVTLTVTTESG